MEGQATRIGYYGSMEGGPIAFTAKTRPTSTSYIICRAQCKIKIRDFLYENYQKVSLKIQDSDSRALNQVWGPSEHETLRDHPGLMPGQPAIDLAPGGTQRSVQTTHCSVLVTPSSPASNLCSCCHIHLEHLSSLPCLIFLLGGGYDVCL